MKSSIAVICGHRLYLATFSLKKRCETNIKFIISKFLQAFIFLFGSYVYYYQFSIFNNSFLRFIAQPGEEMKNIMMEWHKPVYHKSSFTMSTDMVTNTGTNQPEGNVFCFSKINQTFCFSKTLIKYI